jgi:uncharacterized tellurite resistance protein B-like protein
MRLPKIRNNARSWKPFSYSGYYSLKQFSSGNSMNILAGILGGIVLWLFFRGFAELGINLRDLNPLLRRRRMRWLNQHNTSPLYNIKSPLEMTALLLVAVAKNNDGEIGTAEKHALLRLFEDKFHLNKRDSSELLIYSFFILQDGSELRQNLQQVLQKSLRRFTPAQLASAISMIDSIAKPVNPVTAELVSKIKKLLKP